MSNSLKTLIQEYSWVHLSLGLLGNTAFLVGSIFFLPRFEEIKTVGVWLFIFGAFFMWIGALGRLLVGIWEEKN